MKIVRISGMPIVLQERSKAQMKGITVGESLLYRFYDGSFHGMAFLFAEPKENMPTPRTLAITASSLNKKFGLPVVFLLDKCPAYERQRLIEKDVFFIVSDKYAHLPMLIANERIRKTKQAKRLSPVAQYLLLFHLQVESLEGKAARDIDGKVPYSYSSITLGITCLEDLGICQKVADGAKRKVLHFSERGRTLWEKAEPYLIDPVEERIYCDELHSNESFPTCGINALAHYTMLNPDPEKMIMVSAKRLRVLKASMAMVHPNVYDGSIIIESWNYPPVSRMGSDVQWVDKLSLAVSLREDRDPRVEGEVKRLINDIEWKD